jgi:hypothetical protein
VDKQKPLGEKNKQGSQQKPDKDNLGSNKPLKDQSQRLPVGPGERSDEESIGRPVQLDKDQQKPRQPAEGQQDRPRVQPAGA